MSPLNKNNFHLGASEIGKLQIELAMNRITDDAWRVIQNSIALENQIHEDLLMFSQKKTHNELKREIFWIELVDDIILNKEYTANKVAYKNLLIEAKLHLFEANSGPRELYMSRYAEYIDVLDEMTILLYINAEIQKRFDPPSIV